MNSIGEQRMELMQKLNIEVKCPSPSSPISSEYKCTRPRGGMQQKHGNVNDTSRVPGCATEISIPNRPREESLGLKHYFEGKRMHNRAQTRSIRPHSAESHHSQHSMMPEGSLLRSYRGEINKPPEICSELDGKRQLLEPRQFETRCDISPQGSYDIYEEIEIARVPGGRVSSSGDCLAYICTGQHILATW